MKDRIDDRDLKIISLLQEDCRMSLTKLAEKVGCSRPTATNRLNRLIDEGIVMTAGNLTELGYKMACIGLEGGARSRLATGRICTRGG